MIRVVIVGLGHMGLSHALAHHLRDDSQIVGLVNRSGLITTPELQEYPIYTDFYQALAHCQPNLVVIATYSDSHADFSIAAMKAGAHVFVEKPLATQVVDGQSVVATAIETNKKLVVGYILRHHPSWIRLIQEARAMGGPYVFRLNLNQQSSGAEWHTHKALMQSTSPLVDCGVHYVDVMCQVTDAKAVSVHGIGVRLSDEIAADMYNYGQLQVTFSDGSVGWYEAGWGPMMSNTANAVKDIVSANGSVSIVQHDRQDSAVIEGHTSVGALSCHQKNGDDHMIYFDNEPDHFALCQAEQAYVLHAIADNIDLTRHMNDAVQSLAICLAADESIRSNTTIILE